MPVSLNNSGGISNFMGFASVGGVDVTGSRLKYHSLNDGAQTLGGVKMIRDIFIGFQKWLYEGKTVAAMNIP